MYRQDVVSPQELPEDISALRAQQHRWAKGTVQTARKLLGRIFRDPTVSMHQRVEALFHMTPYFTYPLLVALCVLLLPAIAFAPSGDVHTMLLIDLPLCATSTSSLALFYATAESAQGRSRWGAIRRIPHLIALGAGMAPHLSRGVWEGLRHMAGEFVRTPKKGDAKGSYRARLQAPWAELVMAAVTGTTAVLSLFTGHYLATPFALLFASGFGYVAALVIAEQLGRRPGALPGTASSHSAAWASRADDAPAKA